MQAESDMRDGEAPAADSWYLEGFVGGERMLRRFVLRPGVPLRIGRRENLEISIPDQTVLGTRRAAPGGRPADAP